MPKLFENLRSKSKELTEIIQDYDGESNENLGVCISVILANLSEIKEHVGLPLIDDVIKCLEKTSQIKTDLEGSKLSFQRLKTLKYELIGLQRRWEIQQSRRHTLVQT